MRILLLASLLTGCALLAPRPPELVDPAGGILVQVQFHERWYGATYCGSRPTAWVRADVALSKEGAQTIAHELDHVARIEADGGCEAHQQRFLADPLGVTLDMEAYAYCESARIWAQQERIPLAQAIRRFAAKLLGYGLGISEERAALEIARRCAA